MKRGSRIILFALSFAMMLTISPNYALASYTDSINALYEDYAVEAIQRFILISGIGTEGADFSISQPVPVYNDDDEYNKAVFLFQNGNCVGQMMTTYVNSQFVSSFVQCDFQAVTEISVQKTPFILISFDEALWIVTSEASEVIVGQGCGELPMATTDQPENYENQVLELTPISLPEHTVRPKSASYLLDVPYVENSTSPDSGKGICWAAAMASIIMYRTGINGITADDLYDTLREYYDSNVYWYPDGSCPWIERLFSWYNLSYTHKHSGTNFDTVKSIIEYDGRPIYCWITRTNGAHSVAICGFDSGYGYYYYSLVDPNVENPVWVQVSSSASSNSFTYASSYGYTYTGWKCHMY